MPFRERPPKETYANSHQLAVKRLVQQIERSSDERKEQLVGRFFELLVNNPEFATAALEKIDGKLDHLRIKDSDGWLAMFQIASYSATSAVTRLLQLASVDESYKLLVAEEHELIGGVTMSSFALAVATLKDRGEDIGNYRQMAKELGVEV